MAQSGMKELITLGHEQKYITHAEINEYVPEAIGDRDQFVGIIQMLDARGIPVYESDPVSGE
ncbi:MULTISPECIES: RNA polymerase sigma factor region1.1 domain-containing protein [Nocardia]|uniref:RNA polymerase sigma factor region1.1 domain-containing protein n=1 Tax=Nocardia iowensis TaxID=204891 RepID=A0ABX8RVZ2_NOCIO|nr:RNA polymerase sigma factor region1.1 domain-containing protein [Nocardia iowensis]QXN93047.1 RNA polymerase sigma factor region1.1 domain-containing protein [Nocardia iowensis]